MKADAVTVFCGSRPGSDPLYEAAAKKLGELIALKGKTLVYGGGNKGLMGAVANAVMHGGGKVIGVIPEILLEWEAQHDGITELHVVENMHVRKRMMYELCDAAIILPGGYGTMDELFEMLTWNTLQIHNKKIVLLNIAGYYDHLIAFIDQMYKKEYLYSDWRERLIVCTDAVTAIGVLV